MILLYSIYRIFKTYLPTRIVRVVEATMGPRGELIGELTETDNFFLQEGLENIANKGYLGKILIAGRDESGTYDILSYGVTARRASRRFETLHVSKALHLRALEEYQDPSTPRELVRSEPDLNIHDTASQSIDNKLLQELEYVSVVHYKNMLIAGSSHHTRYVLNAAQEHHSPSGINAPLLILVNSFEKQRGYNGELLLEHYDFPDQGDAMVPRISAVVNEKGVAFGRIKKGLDGKILEDIHEKKLEKGIGWYISTHTWGKPEELLLLGKTPEETCSRVYKALGHNPKRNKDFRVGVATIFYDPVKNITHQAVYKAMHR